MKILSNIVNNKIATISFQNTDKMETLTLFKKALKEAGLIIQPLTFTGINLTKVQIDLVRDNTIIFVAAREIMKPELYLEELDDFLNNSVTETLGSFSKSEELDHILEPADEIKILFALDRDPASC